MIFWSKKISHTVFGHRDIQVKPLSTRCAHIRSISVKRPKLRCPCNLEERQSCAKFPDLNLAQNFFHLIEMSLKAYAREFGWPKNKYESKDRIIRAIDDIHEEWFKKHI